MSSTLDQLAVIERRDHWIQRLARAFFITLFALLLSSVIVGGLAFILNQREQAALDSRRDATRRIDTLQQLVTSQARQITDNANQIGQLSEDVRALIEQLRQNKLTPVVTASARPRATSGPSTGPSPSSTPRPSSRPSPTSRPTPRPTPQPTCTRLPVVNRCP